MNTNYSQAKNWIISAISDIEILLYAIKKKFYSLVAFKSQFATEKLNKALITLFGLKIEKVHNPSIILKKFLKEKEEFEIKDNFKIVILNLLKISAFFETQGTKTRYGTVIDNNLVIAEEIYSKFEEIKPFLINIHEYIGSYLIILEEIFKFSEKNFPELNKLKKLNKKLIKKV